MVKWLAAAVAALVLLSFAVGRFPVSLHDVVSILASRWIDLPRTWPDAVETVVLGIRLPRVLAAVLVGGALASAGAAYQSLFKNPLVSPAILGVSAGAGFGAAIALILDWPWYGVQALAFAGGLVAVGTSLTVGRSFRAASITGLVLAGIVVTAFFEALISLVKFGADPVNKLPAITFWLLGGLGKAGPRDVSLAAIPIGVGFVLLLALRWRINVLALGDDEARALGIDATRTRLVAILATTLMTAGAVSISGIVGWVGLLVPHAARLLTGPRFERLLPAACLAGAGYVLLMDDAVRMFETEIPLGILTALAGAPFFVYLLSRVQKEWS